MRRPQEIQKDVVTMGTLVNLTSVFESLASMRIAQVKSQVLQSEKFFAELWKIYTQIRVDNLFRFGRGEFARKKPIEKDLLLAVTAEGGFSGDIDQRLVRLMLKDYDPNKHDIIIIGHHGAIQLVQNGISFKKFYKLPSKDQNINVQPIVDDIQMYQNTMAYYQTYISLTVQDVKRMNLSKAVQEQGEIVTAKHGDGKDEELITEENYIFEPSTFEVVDHLERSMVNIILAQIILESKLAQYASRFRAMTAAHERADDSLAEFRRDFNRSKRAIKDERLKEIINGLRMTKGKV
jgi:ATP synthase F1 gamma subunit